jgi:hypothetical protein
LPAGCQFQHRRAHITDIIHLSSHSRLVSYQLTGD